MDTKEKFKEEFEKTCNLVLSQFPNKNGQEREIVGLIINNFLHEVQLDCEKMCFIDFYKKYLSGSLFFNCDDFTKKQIVEIIQESTLCDRDRQLAIMYWVEMETEEKISDKLQIDRKTVRNNIPKISVMLKETSAKLYK